MGDSERTTEEWDEWDNYVYRRISRGLNDFLCGYFSVYGILSVAMYVYDVYVVKQRADTTFLDAGPEVQT